MASETKNPLKLIVGWTILVFILLFVFYAALKILLLNDPSLSSNSILTDVTRSLESAATTYWVFISPLLQLSIVLVIIEWILAKLGISLTSKPQNIQWNVQTIIALVIICAFAIAALADIKGASYLKDMALVVVGFYFGSQKQNVSTQTTTSDEVNNTQS